MESLKNRKKEHIDLTFKSLTTLPEMDQRFHYEPMLQAHPAGGLQPFSILGKEQKVPIWVSSMTGGTKLAGTINRNLAMACNEFGMGMGLGSCRIIMDNDTSFKDFDMRDILGEHLPLWANLGIAQVEELLERNKIFKASDLVKKLRADGLIVHVNPIQEWFQPEGDILSVPPLDTIKRLLDYVNDIVARETPVCRELIISGGVKNFLDGYYLVQKSILPAVYGLASTLLEHAREDYAQLRDFVHTQVRGLEMAHAYLSIRE